jgi:hypothetical protein
MIILQVPWVNNMLSNKVPEVLFTYQYLETGTTLLGSCVNICDCTSYEVRKCAHNQQFWHVCSLSSTSFKFSNDSFFCSLINGIKQEGREVVTISPADLEETE